MIRGVTATSVVRLSAAAAGAALKASMVGWDAKFVIATDASCNGTTAGATASGNSTAATIVRTG